jgi:hypothetical protein
LCLLTHLDHTRLIIPSYPRRSPATKQLLMAVKGTSEGAAPRNVPFVT